MQRYTNLSGIALPLAVFLATDDYDYEPGVISATALIKPLRQMVLSKRVNPTEALVDISGLVSSRMGSAIHSALEKAWADPVTALKALGYPEKVYSNIRVNPTKEMLAQNPNAIPVYMEQRSYKTVGKYKLSGKFDFVAEGKVHDYKSTSVYSYLNQSNKDKYILQGSIYRWLNPEIITQDTMFIHYIFTDWSKAQALADPEYPQSRVFTQALALMSLEETQDYVENKLRQFEKYQNAKEAEIPLCEDTDLWRKETVYKYYRDPSKTAGRSTKNFSSRAEAGARLAADGHKGVVLEVKGQVVACKYCPAFTVCSQKDAYIQSGELVLD